MKYLSKKFLLFMACRRCLIPSYISLWVLLFRIIGPSLSSFPTSQGVVSLAQNFFQDFIITVEAQTLNCNINRRKIPLSKGAKISLTTCPNHLRSHKISPLFLIIFWILHCQGAKSTLSCLVASPQFLGAEVPTCLWHHVAIILDVAKRPFYFLQFCKHFIVLVQSQLWVASSLRRRFFAQRYPHSYYIVSPYPPMLENVPSIFYNFLNTSSSRSKVKSELPCRSATVSWRRSTHMSLTSCCYHFRCLKIVPGIFWNFLNTSSSRSKVNSELACPFLAIPLH